MLKQKQQQNISRKSDLSKSYKLRKEIVDAYAAACKKAGVSAAGQLTKMMTAFIEETEKEK